MIKLLLADDHPILRKGLHFLIAQLPDTMIVAEAEDGKDALDKIRHYKPDVAFMDITMPCMSGLEVIKTIKKETSKTDFVVLTMHDGIEYYRKAMDAGANAYLSKNVTVEELMACMEALQEGRTYVSDSVLKKLNSTTSELHNLTSREIEVLRLLIGGKTNREIAEALFCSEKNVEKIKTNVRKKLDLPSSYGALLSWAIRNRVFL
ncbi:response regulator transcription factor [Sinomicrobium kalidii]|uniref:response regulator n=1 Tax=Sinomicrobium kalidii TaxID=2900738 RepID=UPI001E3E69C6|nr:response regulator transcription factor [Sinomicrobium kalidii]UGU16297.1 response regulator transcription factor [Sinomicrobium kalidii]